jgi:hypothetical protein
MQANIEIAKMRFRLRTLLLLVAVVGAALGLGGRTFFAIANSVQFGHRHVAVNRFAKLPADDFAMLEWMRKQPGVHNVIVHRFEDKVYIEWWEHRTILETRRADPNINAALTRFGYKNPPIVSIANSN